MGMDRGIVQSDKIYRALAQYRDNCNGGNGEKWKSEFIAIHIGTNEK